jgi:predicted RND superfamily exporter protein
MRIDYRRTASSIYRHHVPILVGAVALAVAAGSLASRLKLNSDLADLLPRDYVSVQELNRIRAQVGSGVTPLLVVVTGDSLAQVSRFVVSLADSLEHSPLITAVSRGRNADFVSRNRLLYMDRDDLDTLHQRLANHIEDEKLKRSPLYVGLEDEGADSGPTRLDLSDLAVRYRRYDVQGLERDFYLTEEKNGIILRVYPAGTPTDARFTRELLNGIDRTIEAIGPARFDPTLAWSYQGSFRNTARQYDAVRKDLAFTSLYSYVGVLLLIALYFRQVLAAVCIGLPLLMGLAWTFGATYLVVGNLNQITVGLFAILSGLGIDYGIHVFARYREARRRQLSVEDALHETLTHTGNSLTTSAVTTSVAFFSLLATDFRGFQEFGFIVGSGILLSLAAMLLVVPAMVVLLERLGVLHLQGREVPPHLLRRGRYPWPGLTVAAAAVISLYAAGHLPDLEFEYDFQKLQPAAPAGQQQVTLPDEVREGRSPAIILAQGRVQAEAVVAAVERLKAEHGTASTIRSVKSVYSYLPTEQAEKLDTIHRIDALLRDNLDLLSDEQRTQVDSLRRFLDVRELTLADLPRDMTVAFTGIDGHILDFVMINAAVPLRDGRNAIAFADEIGQVRTAAGQVYHASSSNIIFAEMLKYMVNDGALALGLTLVVVSLVLWLDFRKPLDALLALSPLLTALLWATGFMYVLGIRLNLYNMIAFPTVVGMGVDNGVHVLHRYREGGPGSLRLVLRTTGMTLGATSLSNMVGFLGCLSANHPALTSISVVALIGMGCCLATTLTLLPALLQLRERWRRS